MTNPPGRLWRDKWTTLSEPLSEGEEHLVPAPGGGEDDLQKAEFLVDGQAPFLRAPELRCRASWERVLPEKRSYVKILIQLSIRFQDGWLPSLRSKRQYTSYTKLSSGKESILE